MTTAVGLWIGAATSTAAIVRDDASEQSAPEFVERDTILYTTEDGTTTLGVDPGVSLARTATDFVDRVGDPHGIVLDDGIAYRAEDLLSTAVFCLLDCFPEDVSPDGAALALAHPQDWSPDTVAAVIESLNYLGLRGVSLVPVDTVDTALPPSGHIPAHLAALAALAAPAVGDAATEQFAAVPATVMPTLAPLTMVDAPAYSAVTGPIPTPPVPMATTPTTVPTARPAPRRRGRAPIVVAVGAAAAFALVGGAIAIAMGEHSQTAVPPITNAEPPPPTTTTSATPAAPIAFPTVPTTVDPYVAPPVVEVAQVATTTAPPPPVQTTPPPIETTPPPATTEAPTTTEPPPATTDPTTTNEPTATEPTVPTTTEPTTTTEPATDARVHSGTVYTGTLQPTLLDEMPNFDDYFGDGSDPGDYPPARP